MTPSIDRLSHLRDLVSQDGGVDLHSHSRHSDGAWTPTELIVDAWKQGVRLVALTDHDTVAGQVEAATEAARIGMNYLTGIEVTTHLRGRAFHVLCYDLDPAAPVWGEIRRRRREAVKQYHIYTFDRVRERGFDVTPDAVQTENGEFLPNPVARALVAAGRAGTIQEGQQVVRNLHLPFPYEIVALPIIELGRLVGPRDAVCSIAHPAREEHQVTHRLSEDDLTEIQTTIPLVALEAFHPYHRPDDVEHFRALAHRHGLAITCGSDAHGWNVGRPPKPTSASTARDFLELIGNRWRDGAAVTTQSEEEPAQWSDAIRSG